MCSIVRDNQIRPLKNDFTPKMESLKKKKKRKKGKERKKKEWKVVDKGGRTRGRLRGVEELLTST